MDLLMRKNWSSRSTSKPQTIYLDFAMYPTSPIYAIKFYPPKLLLFIFCKISISFRSDFFFIILQNVVPLQGWNIDLESLSYSLISSDFPDHETRGAKPSNLCMWVSCKWVWDIYVRIICPPLSNFMKLY